MRITVQAHGSVARATLDQREGERNGVFHGIVPLVVEQNAVDKCPVFPTTLRERPVENPVLTWCCSSEFFSAATENES